MNKTYIIKGYVYGNYWGGGRGAYPSEKLEGKNKSYLLKKAQKMLDNGSLDSGMGYESLIGAILDVGTITTTSIKDKIFENEEWEVIYLGGEGMKDEEWDFLENVNI
jgi:hypothetical protein